MPTFDRIGNYITSWMVRFGMLLLKLSVGIVTSRFGVLNFIPGLSSANKLAIRTIDLFGFGLVSGELSIGILSALSVLIGVGLL